MQYFVMCIGNRDGGDDAIGPYIADQLKKDCTDLFVVDCATIPENYTNLVKCHKPRNLIIIDAVEMGLLPGDIRIIPKRKIGKMHISTHGIPLSILITYLEKYISNILFIGLQPKTMSGKLTRSVKKSGEDLVTFLKNRNLSQIKKLK